MNTMRWLALVCTALMALTAQAEDLRIGMVGLDTSHVTAFTRILNDNSAKDHIPGGKVVAAVKDSSPDIKSSYSRVEKYTTELTDKWGVKLYPTVTEMCRHVDAVMVENVDGRPHLKHATDVIKAGNPLFIDKPLAGTLDDEHEWVRRNAAEALGNIGPAAFNAVPALSHCLHDEHSWIRHNVAMSLAKIGPSARDAIPALKANVYDLSLIHISEPTRPY